MSPRRTLAIAGRVLNQLHHDPRTIGLVLFVPSLLMILLRFVFNTTGGTFQYIAPVLLSLFPLVLMFLITAIATLRERTAGTLERLLTMPMAKLDYLLGYALAFGALAILQGVLAASVTLGWLGVTVQGGTGRMLLVAALAGTLGMSMGLFVSAFARTEFQAVQFMPAFIFPQLLIGGFLVPRDQMAKVLQWLANVMPLTYTLDAMKQVSQHSGWTHDLSKDLAIMVGFTLGALILGAATLRRSRPGR